MIYASNLTITIGRIITQPWQRLAANPCFANRILELWLTAGQGEWWAVRDSVFILLQFTKNQFTPCLLVPLDDTQFEPPWCKDRFLVTL